MQNYSHFFKTLHDETSPTGYLGRGTHYSILRAVSWYDQLQNHKQKATFQDFAIIWDEDHDIRVIEVIEKLYFDGLLSPAIIVGERKAFFTILVEEDTVNILGTPWLSKYRSEVEKITQNLSTDSWTSNVATINSKDNGIISDNFEAVTQYLNTINMLWHLGINDIKNSI